MAGGSGYGKRLVILSVVYVLHFPTAAWSSSVDSGVNSVVSEWNASDIYLVEVRVTLRSEWLMTGVKVWVRERVEVRVGVVVRGEGGVQIRFRD